MGLVNQGVAYHRTVGFHVAERLEVMEFCFQGVRFQVGGVNRLQNSQCAVRVAFHKVLCKTDFLVRT